MCRIISSPCVLYPTFPSLYSITVTPLWYVSYHLFSLCFVSYIPQPLFHYGYPSVICVVSSLLAVFYIPHSLVFISLRLPLCDMCRIIFSRCDLYPTFPGIYFITVTPLLYVSYHLFSLCFISHIPWYLFHYGYPSVICVVSSLLPVFYIPHSLVFIPLRLPLCDMCRIIYSPCVLYPTFPGIISLRLPLCDMCRIISSPFVLYPTIPGIYFITVTPLWYVSYHQVPPSLLNEDMLKIPSSLEESITEGIKGIKKMYEQDEKKIGNKLAKLVCFYLHFNSSVIRVLPFFAGFVLNFVHIP